MDSPFTCLNNDIAKLERKQATILQELKHDCKAKIEELKPVNILKAAGENLLLKVKVESNTLSKLLGLGVDNLYKKFSNTVAQHPLILAGRTVFSLLKK